MTQAGCEFQVFAKPAGAACNLACSYCYYLEKESLYPDAHAARMPDDLLELYIVQHIEASRGPLITFSWHGGEPTILGLEYFCEIVAIERRRRPAGCRIVNGIQTNGILLDEDWCRFLAAEGFGVGLSIDGPPELHDGYRLTRGGEPTHRHAMRAFDLLKRFGVPCDLLCAVHDRNVRQPLDVYRFFREIGARFVGFLPIVRRKEATGCGVTPDSVSPEAFGAFLCTIFDEWAKRDAGRIAIQIFDEASRPARGLEHSLCIFRETCGEIPVVEHNGDFYSCDHFVDHEHRMGNIRETPLARLLDSPEQRAFGQAKRDLLPRCCRTCGVRAMCNGGCPKDRFALTPDGEEALNYLCSGFKRFFTYSRPYFKRLAQRGQAGKPAQPSSSNPYPQSGRNDPCPCGSGLKYKKCCMAG